MQTYKLFDNIHIINVSVSKFDWEKRYIATWSLEWSRINFDSAEKVTYDNRPSRASQQVEIGDLIFAKMQWTEKTLVIDKSNKEYIYSSWFFIIRPNNNLDKNYLYQFLKSKDFHKQKDRLCTWATQKALTLGWIQKISIPLPPLATQRAIADKLDKLQSLIDLKKQAIIKNDELTKSIFLEMFGDPMKNEKGREVKKLGEVIEINPKKSELQIEDKVEVSFLPMEAVGEKWEIFRNYKKTYGEVKTWFTYFKEWDVLFAKITPCMENGKWAIAKWLYNGVGFWSTEFHVMRPNDKLLWEFIYFVFSFSHVRERAEKNMTGSAWQKRVPADFLKKFDIPLPPLPLQQKFADIITQIEAQKSEHKLALAKLEELYQAEMQKSFSL